eukprot:3920177-Amphidinium_carterae.1
MSPTIKVVTVGFEGLYLEFFSMYGLLPVRTVTLLSSMSGSPRRGDCTLATMKQICIVIDPMINVTSFQPSIVKPSPVTVTYCFRVDSGIGLTSMCSQNVMGQTLTAAPVSMINAQKPFRCR